jgi:hypothetical protein
MNKTTLTAAAGSFFAALLCSSSVPAEDLRVDVLDVAVMPALPIATDLPADARTGECFAQILAPAKFDTVTDHVLVSEASQRVEVMPARYETISEQVLIAPASTRIEAIPARYEWVDQQVIAEPARTEWRRADCRVSGAVANATGECACLINVPARFDTVRKQVLVEPASTRTIDVPAQYQAVQKTVMRSPAVERRVAVPAVYKDVTRTVLVSDAHPEWVRIACDASQMFSKDPASTLRLQRALRDAGYNPGAIDGEFEGTTERALMAWQKDHGLAPGSCEGGPALDALH